MTPLLTTDQLTQWLRIDEEAEPEWFFDDLILQASQMVVAYIRYPAKIGWDLNDPATAPIQMKTACALICASLYADRESGGMTDAARHILDPLRGTAYAKP